MYIQTPKYTHTHLSTCYKPFDVLYTFTTFTCGEPSVPLPLSIPPTVSPEIKVDITDVTEVN